MRKKLASLVVLVLVGTGTPALAQQYEFTLDNQSGLHLVLIVDNVPKCAAPSGDRCTTLVSPIRHCFTAAIRFGRNIAVRCMNLDGPFTWTIPPPR